LPSAFETLHTKGEGKKNKKKNKKKNGGDTDDLINPTICDRNHSAQRHRRPDGRNPPEWVVGFTPEWVVGFAGIRS
jgi:hypothetical protein